MTIAITNHNDNYNDTINNYDTNDGIISITSIRIRIRIKKNKYNNKNK